MLQVSNEPPRMAERCRKPRRSKQKDMSGFLTFSGSVLSVAAITVGVKQALLFLNRRIAPTGPICASGPDGATAQRCPARREGPVSVGPGVFPGWSGYRWIGWIPAVPEAASVLAWIADQPVRHVRELLPRNLTGIRHYLPGARDGSPDLAARSIHPVTEVLERLIEEDAAAERPFVAALVI
jgi:hypothetical protein